MSESLVLLAPAANHVYAGQAGRLCAAELSLTCPNATSVAPVTVAGVEYLSIHSEDPLPPADLAAVARSSAALACFEYRGDLLAPLELPQVDVVDEDLVTIPKYRGKTNEQFTRLLLNLTLASLEGRCATRRDEGQRLAILDRWPGAAPLWNAPGGPGITASVSSRMPRPSRRSLLTSRHGCVANTSSTAAAPIQCDVTAARLASGLTLR